MPGCEAAAGLPGRGTPKKTNKRDIKIREIGKRGP
jgi:hypothetical protein